MRTLVTGVAGCIGSDLAEALIARGDHVLGIDNFSSGKPEHISGLCGPERFQTPFRVSFSGGGSDLASYYSREAGALGGKLLGAGGGGFLLFFCEPHNQDRLRAALSDLRELTFSFDLEGSKIVHVGSDHA